MTSARICHRVINENKTKEPSWNMTRTGYDSDSLPNGMDERFKQWVSKGLVTSIDLYVRGTQQQLQDLKKHYGFDH